LNPPTAVGMYAPTIRRLHAHRRTTPPPSDPARANHSQRSRRVAASLARRRAGSDWRAAWTSRQPMTLTSCQSRSDTTSKKGRGSPLDDAAAARRRWSTSKQGRRSEKSSRWSACGGRNSADALEWLHRRDLLWMNFDPSEFERDEGPGGGLTNSMSAFLQRPGAARYWRAQAYATPEVVYLKTSDSAADRRLSPRHGVPIWLARQLQAGIQRDGLEADRLHLPPLRNTTRPHLPEGFAAVLAAARRPKRRIDIRRRPLSSTICARRSERAQKRRAFNGGLAWEIGSKSIGGAGDVGAQAAATRSRVVHSSPAPTARSSAAPTESDGEVGNGALARSSPPSYSKTSSTDHDGSRLPNRMKQV